MPSIDHLPYQRSEGCLVSVWKFLPSSGSCAENLDSICIETSARRYCVSPAQLSLPAFPRPEPVSVQNSQTLTCFQPKTSRGRVVFSRRPSPIMYHMHGRLTSRFGLCCTNGLRVIRDLCAAQMFSCGEGEVLCISRIVPAHPRNFRRFTTAAGKLPSSKCVKIFSIVGSFPR